MSDIFREIEQEIRRDDALELWAKYQIPVYVLAALVLIALGAWRYWEYRTQQNAEARGAQYEAAIQLGQNGKADESQAALNRLAQGQGGGYAILARFSAADARSAKDPAGAAKDYDAIAADPQVPQLMRNLARLRSALIHVDDPDPKAAEARLQEIAGPTDPFHDTAREQLAILALAQKDYQAAGRWLDMIVSDPLAPTAARARAESLEGLVAGAGPAPQPQAKPQPKAMAPSALGGKAQ